MASPLAGAFASGRILGVDAQLAFYQDLATSAYLVTELGAGGIRRILELNQQHRDLRLGFVDTAVVATAEDLGIRRVATTDRRPFGAVALRITLELLP